MRCPSQTLLQDLYRQPRLLVQIKIFSVLRERIFRGKLSNFKRKTSNKLQNFKQTFKTSNKLQSGVAIYLNLFSNTLLFAFLDWMEHQKWKRSVPSMNFLPTTAACTARGRLPTTITWPSSLLLRHAWRRNERRLPVLLAFTKPHARNWGTL